MTTADGTVLGVTKIVDRGPNSSRWNLVFLGDGYRTNQMAQYAADVQRVTNTFLGTAPFSSRLPAINVHRVDVTSTDSGADDPTACGGPGTTVRTYFDSAFCNSGIRRLLTSNTSTAISVAEGQVPEWNAILLVVNSTVYGGSGGAIAVFSLAPAAEEIALHELGHSAFGLADEYDCFVCDGLETDRNNHPPVEPAEANVTIASTRGTIKWRRLIQASTPVPTTSNPDCTTRDSQPSPVPAGTVGAFEGAHYFHCDAYRPEFRCRMYELARPFCAVCQRRISRVLPTQVPDVRELRSTVAVPMIVEAGLTPRTIGGGPGAWVYQQRPRADTVVPTGSTVTLQLRTGPIP
jgi:IgA Peptidase M64/PASTA domain